MSLLLFSQLCPTLCNPMDYSLPGSSVHRISQQEYWSGLPFPSPGDLPGSGIKLDCLVSLYGQADSLPLSHQGNSSVAVVDAIIVSTRFCSLHLPSSISIPFSGSIFKVKKKEAGNS